MSGQSQLSSSGFLSAVERDMSRQRQYKRLLQRRTETEVLAAGVCSCRTQSVFDQHLRSSEYRIRAMVFIDSPAEATIANARVKECVEMNLRTGTCSQAIQDLLDVRKEIVPDGESLFFIL